LQNHLMQIFSLFAMEPPSSLNPDDISREKIKLLSSAAQPSFKDLVIGQYTANENHVAYNNEPLVAQGSLTETFAQVILRVNNTRWEGVPFIISCGKGLDERKAEICIQFHEFPGHLFPTAQRNELVLQIQPNEAVTLKLMNKSPGFFTDLQMSDLNLMYKDKFAESYKLDPYEHIISDAIAGDRYLFVTARELEESWRILTPLLHQIRDTKPYPIPYPFGTAFLAQADAVARRVGWRETTPANVTLWSNESGCLK